MQEGQVPGPHNEPARVPGAPRVLPATMKASETKIGVTAASSHKHTTVGADVHSTEPSPGAQAQGGQLPPPEVIVLSDSPPSGQASQPYPAAAQLPPVGFKRALPQSMDGSGQPSKAARLETQTISPNLLTHTPSPASKARLSEPSTSPPAKVPVAKPPPAPKPSAASLQRVVPSSLTTKPTSSVMDKSTGVDTQAALQAVLENLALNGEEEMEPPAKSMMVSVMKHQRMALAWMVKREATSNPPGGILADDQGLGKTVSTISLIVTNKPDPAVQGKRRSVPAPSQPPATNSAQPGDAQMLPGAQEAGGVAAEVPQASRMSSSGAGPSSWAAGSEVGAGLLCGGTLVVCPTTVLHQWQREIQEKVNQTTNNMTVHIYHGKDKVTSAAALSKYSVVLTTYGMLSSEAPPSVRQSTGKKKVKGGSPLIIIDESSDEEELQGAGQEVSQGFKTESGMGQGSMGFVKSEIKDEKKPIVKSESKGVVAAQWVGEDALRDGGSRSSSVEAPGKPSQANKSRDALTSSTDAKRTKASAGSVQKGNLAGEGSGGGPLFDIHWHRVVLDEAQTIKNRHTLVAHAAWHLPAGRRWCLSGTPIQNSVEDLFSYFRFLGYAPYNQHTAFKALIRDKVNKADESGFKILQAVLQPILLRRTKHTKFNGEPIVNLPARNQELVQQEFKTPQEAAFYAQVQEESRKALEDQEGSSVSYGQILYSLLRLRQACNHPWLVRGASATYGQQGQKKPTAAQLTAAKKLPQADSRRLLAAVSGSSRCLCASCQDVPEQPVVSRCCHVYCNDCLATQLEGAGHMDEFTCVTCTSVIRSNEVYTAAALQAALGEEPAGQSNANGSEVDPAAGGWVSSTKVDQLLQLLDKLRQDSGMTVPASGPAPRSQNVLAARSKADKALARTFKTFSSPHPAPYAMASRNQRAPEKVIVFSQWTGMLDLLEQALKHHKHQFRRLDGTMSIANRENAIADFGQKPEVNVLLVSLKAAALGVNLTMANHVVLMDLWWNPTTEEQAIDRAHRIGQRRAVHVTRITIKGTVEERILELQERKRQLVAASLSEGEEQLLAS